ncbi:serine/threonine-protein kinase [Nocardioides sp. AX2bis]|uniref:serine/threonine-protein kinase n=1 Tax=Nocardioides sp. AX2bis TaxID=2653157 RepID=UPI0012F1AC11|nr:serine/threonine-protein kinase [Nocardioides sp. AX2bis]VXB63159.1 putative Serine/threonine-protein kinase PknA [Nocardioides sp. AX2bis]
MIANRYSLEREIGRGGMGAVWLGRDELLGRAVAIKRVGRAPGLDNDPEADLKRAEREARIAASLNHRHVVAVFDLVEEHEEQWLVMEYVEGRSLSQTVRDDGPLDVDRAGAILADAAGALATAHAAGIVHRDVKPSNILLTALGEAKLLDFGIARAQGDLTLTQTGLVSGSPAYLAPEVASGAPATTASDVWSLGATLFHLLAGHPPYDVGDNIVGGLYRIVHEEPPTVEDAGWLTPLLAATMVRDPDRRWSMAHVASYLQAGPRDVGPVDQDRTRLVAAVPPVDATQVTAPVQDATAPRTAVVPPVVPPGGSAAAGHDGAPGRTGRRRPLLVLGALVLLLLAAIVFFLLLPDEQQDAPTADPAPSVSSSPSETDDPSPSADPSDEPSPAAPTAEGMQSFVSGYLQTAASDPDGGFAMLTPSFQQASGGLSGYTGFWGQVTSVEPPEFVEVDPESLTVRYTYTYRTANGGAPTDTVGLRLAYDPATDRYLIADEA